MGKKKAGKHESFFPTLAGQSEVRKTFAVNRDGDLCGVGLSHEEAETLVAECSTAYPEVKYSIVPGGVFKPGNKEKK